MMPMPARVPDPPLALLAELTHRCPLACPYCANPLDLERASAELDTAGWLRVLDEAAALGVLAGAFLRRRAVFAARLCSTSSTAPPFSNGLYSNLITSGVTLDEAGIGRLVVRRARPPAAQLPGFRDAIG